ncbi:hypothetical protein B0H66DRAFT_214658 [Apodospora peruviana]|uniref:LysM domain-containing protein n=1 Tax=Apodospora peruviana TaxID=516989 RepID=A0AAE0M8T4_9PEZI|nr:hypothetical protein B0H66DRAFT_214658 [Apodospora peruviana]
MMLTRHGNGWKAFASLGFLMSFLQPTTATYTFYTVVNGDSKTSIAEAHCLSTAALALANPQLTDAYYTMVNGVVQIPASCNIHFEREYLVLPGDTFFNLAKDNNVEFVALAAANPQIKDVNHIDPGDCIIFSVAGAHCSRRTSTNSHVSRSSSS